MNENELSPAVSRRQRFKNWTAQHKTRMSFFSLCLVAYAAVMVILADGGFALPTVALVVQSLNIVGFFLALAALLKKSK